MGYFSSRNELLFYALMLKVDNVSRIQFYHVCFINSRPFGRSFPVEMLLLDQKIFSFHLSVIVARIRVRELFCQFLDRLVLGFLLRTRPSLLVVGVMVSWVLFARACYFIPKWYCITSGVFAAIVRNLELLVIWICSAIKLKRWFYQ